MNITEKKNLAQRLGEVWDIVSSAFRSLALISTVLLAIFLCLPSIYTLLRDKPIFVGNFVVATSAGNAGLTAEALADHLKAQFSQINQDAGDLFEVRKLSDTNVPLDVKLGDTGVSLVPFLKSIGLRFTTAEITGHISQIGNAVTLHLTMSQGIPVRAEKYVILLPSGEERRRKELFLDEVNRALDCFAIHVIAVLSPDVAANYLHTVEDDGTTLLERRAV